MIIFFASLALLWTTWTMGGLVLWAQIGSNVLAFFCLVAAVWKSESRGWANMRSLVRFVPFWLGLFLVAYMLVQFFNAAWVFEPGASGRMRVRMRDYIEWLPSGVWTPSHMTNPWRMALVLTPAWMVTCALWAGSHRGKTQRILMWVLVLNATLFAVIGILQDVTHARKVLWLFEKPYERFGFWGTIVNQNHASAFMNIGIICALSLVLWYTSPRGRDITKGGPFLMLIPLSLIMVAGVVNAMSRAGIAVCALIIVAFVAVVLWRFIRYLRSSGNRSLAVVAGAVIVSIVLACTYAGTRVVNADRLYREMVSMFRVAGAPKEDARYYINKASIDLFERKPAYGWGAGCYMYFINITQKQYPRLMTKGRPLGIGFAHNDYINSLCDLGIVGSVPLFACVIGLPVYVVLRYRRGMRGAVAMGLAGLSFLMLHAALEFFFQHPLIVLQFGIALACQTRFCRLRHETETLRWRSERAGNLVS